MVVCFFPIGNRSIEPVDNMDTADELDLVDEDIPTVAVNTGLLDRTGRAFTSLQIKKNRAR